MSHPMAWYITWTTYGDMAHGDARGSFLDRTYLLPDPERERGGQSQMTGDAVYLTDEQRAAADKSLVEECRAQGWELHARNVRRITYVRWYRQHARARSC